MCYCMFLVYATIKTFVLIDISLKKKKPKENCQILLETLWRPMKPQINFISLFGVLPFSLIKNYNIFTSLIDSFVNKSVYLKWFYC